MIKAVFFDLDETLVDVYSCHSFAFKQAFDLFNLDYQQAKKLSSNYESLGRRINEILSVRKKALNISEQTLPLNELATVREKYFLNCIKKKAKLFPGARQAVTQAKELTQAVAIVSSGTHKFINLCLTQFKLKSYIDYIVGEQDVTRGKPYPDAYLKAFNLLPQNLKINKSECLVVEDSVNGVKAAQAAGLKVVFVPSKYTKGTIKADWQLSSLTQFNLNKLTNS